MERSSFFDSILDQSGNPDRNYLSEDIARYFAAFIGNGIFPNPATNLQVIAMDNNMNIRIKSGKAWITGYFYENTDDYIFKLDVADGVLNRIDRVILRLDFLKREIKVYVRKSDYASNAIPKPLLRDADGYEIALADIAVNKGIISISQANITDLRLNKELCGIVHGVVDQVDVTTLFNQYTEGFKLKEQGFEQEFNAWFNTIKNTLGTDVAGNLLNQINGVAGTGRTVETVKGNADAISALANTVSLHKAEKATSTTKGHVQPDGVTITVDSNGVIKVSQQPVGSTIYAYKNIGGAL